MLEQLEENSRVMTYSSAVEIAMQMKKLQFAKTLIGKQVDAAKLCQEASYGRNLIAAMARECGPDDSADLQPDIVDMLMAAGVDPAQRDVAGCDAVHYACLNCNDALLAHLLKTGKFDASSTNCYGMTPMATLFWNFNEWCEDSRRRRNFDFCLSALMDAGADLDALIPCKMLSHLESGFVSSERSKKGFFPTEKKSTPLIISIVHGSYKITQRLLQAGAYVNQSDQNGLTPFMHAVKSNDLDGAVLQLLIPGGQVPSIAEAKEMKKDPSSIADIQVNLDARDDDGRTVLHHLAKMTSFDDHRFVSMTFDNVEMLNFLLALEIDPSEADKKNKTPLECATESGAWRIAKVLAEATGKTLSDKPAFRPMTALDWVRWRKDKFDYDVVMDAQKMLKKLEIEADKKKRGKKGKQDEDKNVVPIPRGCVVNSGELHKDYTVLMTKVDVNAGAWGIYNFYRMQVRDQLCSSFKYGNMINYLHRSGRKSTRTCGSCSPTGAGSASRTTDSTRTLHSPAPKQQKKSSKRSSSPRAATRGWIEMSSWRGPRSTGWSNWSIWITFPSLRSSSIWRPTLPGRSCRRRCRSSSRIWRMSTFTSTLTSSWGPTTSRVLLAGSTASLSRRRDRSWRSWKGWWRRRRRWRRRGGRRRCTTRLRSSKADKRRSG